MQGKLKMGELPRFVFDPELVFVEYPYVLMLLHPVLNRGFGQWKAL